MNTTRRALSYSFAAQYVSLVVQFVATIIISRILSPSEVGIFSVAAALMSLAQLLRDFGISTYVIQERQLTKERIRSAFGISLLLGWILGVVVFLSASFAGQIYQEVGIENVMKVASLNFLLIPFSSITAAFLRREMNFRPEMLATIFSNVVQSSVTIWCAIEGLSYMSMAWGGLMGTLTTIVVLNLFRPSSLPFLPALTQWKRVLNFGGKMSVATILREMGTVAPEIALGKVLGFHAAGLYTRADGLARLFNRLVMQGIAPVLVPYFAVEKRKQVDMKTSYLVGLNHVTGVGWPFFVFLALVAPQLVVTLYGEDWAGVAPALQVLCVGFSVTLLTNIADSLFQGAGEADRLLRLQFVSNSIKIALIVIAVPFGLMALVWAVAVSPIIQLKIYQSHLLSVLNLSIAAKLYFLRKSIYIAIIVGVSVELAALIADSMRIHSRYMVLFVLVSKSLAAVLSWGLALLILRHPLANEIARLTSMNARRRPGT